MKRSNLKRRARLRNHTQLARRTPLRRRRPLARTPALAASAAQRVKVAEARCIVCGTRARIDPAHLIPRSLGGCDHRDCVVALCRVHHRAYDTGRLDLLPHLEPRFRRELMHAVGHLGLLGALRRLTGARWQPTARA